jgi:2-oxoglutarate/2-oxoacid ferredoxin oxidoreductase subunit alpha
VKEFISSHEVVYVVELNHNGQLNQLLTLNSPELTDRLVSIAHLDGLPLTAKYIIDHLQKMEEK